MFTFNTTIGHELARTFPVDISSEDLFRHVYVVGQTGTGKSTLLENIFSDVIGCRAGGMFIDPHGESFDALLASIPADRTNDVVLIDLTDDDYPVAWNFMAGVPKKRVAGVTKALTATLLHAWNLNDESVPRIRGTLENSIYALTESGGASLADIPRFVEEEEFRTRALSGVTHEGVLGFWKRYDQLSRSRQLEQTESTLSRMRSLLLHPTMETMLSSPANRINLRTIMDEQKLVLVNLAKGQVGEEVARLIGGVLLHSVMLAALSRADTKPHLRRPFFLCADEFPSYGVGGGTLKDSLSEVRKYKLGMVLGHQYTGQVDDGVLEAILGNVGSLVAFRVGSDDAQRLHKAFDCEEAALIDLARYRARVRLLTDGEAGNAYTVQTCVPEQTPGTDPKKVRTRSRERYGRESEAVKLGRLEIGRMELAKKLAMKI